MGIPVTVGVENEAIVCRHSREQESKSTCSCSQQRTRESDRGQQVPVEGRWTGAIPERRLGLSTARRCRLAAPAPGKAGCTVGKLTAPTHLPLLNTKHDRLPYSLFFHHHHRLRSRYLQLFYRYSKSQWSRYVNCLIAALSLYRCIIISPLRPHRAGPHADAVNLMPHHRP